MHGFLVDSHIILLLWLVKIVEINNEIYSLSASADGAEICSPMEPKHNVIRIYYFNKILEVQYIAIHISSGYVLYRALVLYVCPFTCI